MTTLSSSLRRRLGRSEPRARSTALPAAATIDAPPVDIAPNDPLLGYLQGANGPVDVEALELESPGLAALKAAGVKLAVPLVTQGELIGVLNLGPRKSEQEYTTDDRRLLDSLAAQAAPALRVGQLVRQQEAEARTRQRFEQELEVAKLIQQNFLPRELPELDGWRIAAYYQPAREVGGDFYDVIPVPGGLVAFVIGDVTDKGVPAALVMAATRSALRAFAQRVADPGALLEQVNEHLCPDMPAKMFVTCFYGVLDPATGRLRFANAGHDLPYLRTADGVVELRARGMPLGLMSAMAYEEAEVTLAPGDSLLLHSDGIVEAHDPDREMFGFPRLRDAVAGYPIGADVIDLVLRDVRAHTGPEAEQEDDITMVTVQRGGSGPVERLLDDFALPSAEGNERIALDRVATAVAPLGLSPRGLDRLRTAVGEATMNAMEHGNGYRPDAPVRVRVLADEDSVRVLIADDGAAVPSPPPEEPDLDAKLAGLQRPRGWGLYLIKNMVDAVRETTTDGRHTLELTLHLGGDHDR